MILYISGKTYGGDFLPTCTELVGPSQILFALAGTHITTLALVKMRSAPSSSFFNEMVLVAITFVTITELDLGSSSFNASEWAVEQLQSSININSDARLLKDIFNDAFILLKSPTKHIDATIL
jgi:hypothetical protein